MRIRPQAQAVLDRVVPGRLDSLWCEILSTGYGLELLRIWDLRLEQIRACAPVLDCDLSRIVHRAELLSYTNSCLCTAEWVAEDLLTGRANWKGPPLEYFTAGDIEFHEVDIREVYALALAEALITTAGKVRLLVLSSETTPELGE